MKKSLIFSFLTLSIFLFTSCEKKESVKCTLPSTSIDVNPIAVTGENIYLKTPNYVRESNVIFEWTGPNNFHSNLQNPVLTNVTPEMEGEYKLIIKKGICATDELSVYIDVIVNTVVCNQDNNTGYFTNFSTYYFNRFNEFSTQDNTYKISGGTYSFHTYLTFFGNNRPNQGIYNIVKESDILTPGTVKVVFDPDFPSNFNALNGQVLVTYDANNKIVIKYCNIPFGYSSSTSTSTIGSVKFTVIK